MKQTLFRGKRTDNNEWIYGFYFESVADGMKHCYIKYETWDEGFVTYEVIPETVGQLTDLPDNNGNKIFENDILKIISSIRSEIIDNTHAFGSEKREDCAIVLWDYKTGGYKLKVYHEGKYKRIARFSIGHLCVYKAEVIGNIYDNPELLEDMK